MPPYLVRETIRLSDGPPSTSLDSKTFEKPIFSEIGDYDSPNLARIKGFALSEWEHAEDLICTMFSILVRPTGGTFVPHRAIGALFSSGGRRELVFGAAKAYFALLTHDAAEDIQEKAKHLHKAIRTHLRLFSDASYRRDEIAHGVVMAMQQDAHGQDLFFLVPAYYASKKHKIESVTDWLNPTYRMNYSAIERLADQFGLLMSRTGEINRDISEFYHSLPEILRTRHP